MLVFSSFQSTLFFIGTDWEIVAERMIIYVDEAHCPSDAKEIDINTITF
jgi:hypothetical protein